MIGKATVESAILEWIVSHESQTVELIRALIREPSTPGLEYGAQQIVFRQLADLGLDVQSHDIDTATLSALDGFCETGQDYANRPTVVAGWPGAGGGRSLILSSHIDVVPVEEDSGWTHDPWGAEIVGRCLYGRGAWDDKPGIALILVVLRALRAMGVSLRGDIVVQSVPDEEEGGNATLSLCALGYRADAALFVDGVRCAAVIGLMGQSRFRVTVCGVPTGAVGPQRAVNPIPFAAKLIEALYRLEDEMNDAVSAPYGGVDRPVRVNVGQIQAGVWPNSVPTRCVFDGQISFLPDRDLTWARDRVRRAIADAGVMVPWLRDYPPSVEFIGLQAEGCQDTSSPELLRDLSAAHRKVWGTEIKIRKIQGFVDTRHYLAYGIPSVCYGPLGENAHAADEYLDLDSLTPTAQVIALFVMRWCGLVL